jgi:hypothetical protein
MKSIMKRVATLVVVGVVAMTSFAAACNKPTVKCNSGRGNGSEYVGGTGSAACDPGNSGSHNYGGDEGGQYHGGSNTGTTTAP